MPDSIPPGTRFQTAEEARKLVRAIVSELAPAQKTRPTDVARLLDDCEVEAHLVDDLGYHSLALLELAFALEDEFSLQPIDEPTARSIVTVQHVEAHVVGELRATDRLGDDPS